MKLKYGDKVKLQGGGVNDGKTGVIIDHKEIKTSGRGVPQLPGHYKAADWSKEYAIKLDDGEIVTEFKKSVKPVVSSSTACACACAASLVKEALAELVYAESEVLKFSGNTDTVDIDAKCIGVHSWNGLDNRGLGIQIRHNKDPQLFKLANQMAKIIAEALNAAKLPAPVKEAKSAAGDVEVRELEIFIDNESDLYEKYTMPIYKNLTKKMKKGEYKKELAAKAFHAMVDLAAKKYAKEFANPKDWNSIFSPEVRRRVADSLVENFESAYEGKEYDFMKED